MKEERDSTSKRQSPATSLRALKESTSLPIQPSRVYDLPLRHSLRNLTEHLSREDTLSAAKRRSLVVLERALANPKVSLEDCLQALSEVEVAMKEDSLDRAVGLLASKEYSRIAKDNPDPIAYRKALTDLTSRYPVLQHNLTLLSHLDTLLKSHAKGDIDVHSYRADLENILSSDLSHAAEILRLRLKLARGLLPENDAAHGWDWRDPNWYTEEHNLPYPFSAGTNAGVDLSLDQCRREDGWELFVRRILTIDGLAEFEGPGEVAETQKFFALYNTITGVLRLFIHYIQGDYYIDRLLAKTYCSSGS